MHTPNPPLGLAYVAAAVRDAGFDYRVIDATGEALDAVSPYPDRRRLHGAGADPRRDRRADPPRQPGDRDDVHVQHAVAAHPPGGPDDPGEVPEALAGAGRRARHRGPRARAGHQPVRRRGAGRGRGDLRRAAARAPAGAPAVRGEGHRVPERGPRGDQRVVGAAARRGRHPAAGLGRVPIAEYIERHQTNGINLGRSIPILGTRGLPVPVHVLLEPGHVDAALDRPRSRRARRRDGALRPQVPGDELRLPGPHGHREAPVDRGLLSRADRPRPQHHLADAERHPGRGLRRRGGRPALSLGLPGPGLRARERLAGDPQGRQEAGRPRSHAGRDAVGGEARAQAVLLHRHRVPRRHAGHAPAHALADPPHGGARRVGRGGVQVRAVSRLGPVPPAAAGGQDRARRPVLRLPDGLLHRQGAVLRRRRLHPAAVLDDAVDVRELLRHLVHAPALAGDAHAAARHLHRARRTAATPSGSSTSSTPADGGGRSQARPPDERHAESAGRSDPRARLRVLRPGRAESGGGAATAAARALLRAPTRSTRRSPRC